MNGAWQTYPSENFTKRGDVHPLFHHKKPRRDQMCAQSESGFFGLCASVFHEQNSWHRQADERSSPYDRENECERDGLSFSHLARMISANQSGMLPPDPLCCPAPPPGC